MELWELRLLKLCVTASLFMFDVDYKGEPVLYEDVKHLKEAIAAKEKEETQCTE